MKFLNFLSVALAATASLCSTHGANGEPMSADFDDQRLGVLEPDALSSLFGQIQWHSLNGRALLVDTAEPGTQKVLEIHYPAGVYGSKQSGAGFVSKLPPLQDYYLTYKIRFSDEFPFNKGGKLPGLSSSGSEFTGGRLPPKTGGWSARYMWRREGELELYLYHPNMKGPTGDRIALDFRCKPSTWYTLTQRVRVNDQGESNGMIQVWIDGKRCLNLGGLLLKGEKVGLIDSFLFSTFFGGGTKDWSPSSDCSIQFDEFSISCSPPKTEGGASQ